MYGTLIASGILACLFIGEWIIKKKEFNTESYWSAAFWMLVLGLVGARLYHVLDYFDYYLANPIKILYVHQGGMGIYGGIVGGAIGLYLSLHKSGELKKYDYLEWLDVVAVLAPLGQGVGRWGNFFNQELFGLPTNLPWGLYIPPEKRPSMFINNDYFHPMFFYESLLDILLFLGLFLLYRRERLSKKKGSLEHPLVTKNGFFSYSYIIGYGSIRFCLEFIRINSWKIIGINVAQAISVIFICFGIYMLFRLRNKKA